MESLAVVTVNPTNVSCPVSHPVSARSLFLHALNKELHSEADPFFDSGASYGAISAYVRPSHYQTLVDLGWRRYISYSGYFTSQSFFDIFLLDLAHTTTSLTMHILAARIILSGTLKTDMRLMLCLLESQAWMRLLSIREEINAKQSTNGQSTYWVLTTFT